MDSKTSSIFQLSGIFPYHYHILDITIITSQTIHEALLTIYQSLNPALVTSSSMNLNSISRHTCCKPHHKR
ncbi:hypothetical protein V6Z11_A10G137800 [Gossypium hirsutum]